MNDSELRRDYQRAIELRASGGRERCPAPTAIEALAAGDGAEETRLSTLDHVMSCPYCLREFELLRAIHCAGRTARPATAWRRYAVAAAAVLVAGASIFFTLTRESGPVMRGEQTASGPELMEPLSDIAQDSEVRFVWRALPNATRYTVELVEGGGRVRAAAITRDTVWVLPDSARVRRGEQLTWLVRAEFPDGREERSVIARIQVR